MSRSEPTNGPLTPEEVQEALDRLSGAQWKAASSLARLCALGLSDMTPDDLLTEAVVKLLSGERVWQRGVEALIALKMIMRSIASNARKKAINGPIDQYATVDVGAGEAEEDAPLGVPAIDPRTPAAIIEARSELAYIESLVAGDEDVEQVATAWALELRGQEAAEELGFDAKRYDAARKRLMTKLASLKR